MTGIARSTIGRGKEDIRKERHAREGRIRKLGGGDKKKIVKDPTLVDDLKRLVEPATRGDCLRPLLGRLTVYVI